MPFDSENATGSFEIPLQPKAVGQLRLVIILLILLIAGLAGGISYRLIDDTEHDKLSREFTVSVDALASGFVREIEDRIFSVEAMDTVFHVPPGGQAVFPDFPYLAKKLLNVGGGHAYNIEPIVQAWEQPAFEEFMAANSGVFNVSVSQFPDGPQLLQEKYAFGTMVAQATSMTSWEPRRVNASLLPPQPDGSPDFITPESHVYPYDLGTLKFRGMYNDRDLSYLRGVQDLILSSRKSVVSGLSFIAADLVRDPPLWRLGLFIVAPFHWGDPGNPEASTITAFGNAVFAVDEVIQYIMPDALELFVVMSCPLASLTVHLGPQFDTTSFTLLVKRGKVTNLGWGDLRPDTRATRAYSKTVSLNLSVTPYILQVSPTEESVDLFLTNRPRDTCMGAVVLVLGVACAFLAFDSISSRHLRSVVLTAMEQYRERVDEKWSLSSKLTFSDTISTEISGPTWSIVGGMDVLRSSMLTTKQREIVEVMSVGASLILALIEQCRKTDGSSENQRSVISIREAVVKQCWNTVRLQTRLSSKIRAIQLFSKVADNVPDEASLDLPRTRTVFFNLLTNAVARAGAAGSVTWLVDYNASSRTLQSRIIYRGEQFSQEERDLLFSPHPLNARKAAASLQLQATGTPVAALALALNIVTSMGGDMEVESTPSGGEFRVVLRLTREAWSEDRPMAVRPKLKGILKAATTEAPNSGGSSDAPTGPVRRQSARLMNYRSSASVRSDSGIGQHVRVLIGDDDDLCRRSMILMFQLAGASAEAFEDGQTLSDHATATLGCCDICVLDDMMGGGKLDGGPSLQRIEMAYAKAGMPPPMLVLLESGLEGTLSGGGSSMSNSAVPGVQAERSSISEFSVPDGGVRDGLVRRPRREDEPASFLMLRKPVTQSVADYIVEVFRARDRLSVPPPPALERTHSESMLDFSGVKVNIGDV